MWVNWKLMISKIYQINKKKWNKLVNWLIIIEIIIIIIVIHLELCKKVNFDLMNKWYTHKPKSVLENETHKLLLDFVI